MKQYFKVVRVVENEQVSIASMYIGGNAKLWWQTRLDDDASFRRTPIQTWDALKKGLRDHFLPMNTACLARESLKKLKHTGSVRDYVKEFSSLMLEINKPEEDRYLIFCQGSSFGHQ